MQEANWKQFKYIDEGSKNLPSSSFPGSHVSWFLPILLSKNNSELATLQNLAVHLMFSFQSISRIHILDKSKASWLTAKQEKRL